MTIDLYVGLAAAILVLALMAVRINKLSGEVSRLKERTFDLERRTQHMVPAVKDDKRPRRGGDPNYQPGGMWGGGPGMPYGS